MTRSSQQTDRPTHFWLGQVILLALVHIAALLAISNCLAIELNIESARWKDADQLFKRDSRWRGSDAANSIDLGNQRVLWTFGDTFIDTQSEPTKRHRKHARFIRNSIAIQKGYDPTTAEFRAYWQNDTEGTPTAFFRSHGKEFYWPGGGLMLEGKLLVFLMRIRNSHEQLGFTATGWGAVLISNPHEKPSKWILQFIDAPANSLGVMIGSGSSVRQGEWVYSYGARNARHHPLYLTRLLVSDALKGYLSRLEWWNCRTKRWQKDTDESLLPIVEHGQTEFTVHYESQFERYLLTQFKSFPRSPIVMRSSQHLTGPWSLQQLAYTPPEVEKSKKNMMLYAAKAHPEQIAQGLAVTYCTNNTELKTVVNDESVYYPKFIRLQLSSPEEAASK